MLRRYMRTFYDGLRAAVREWTGDAEYERHVRDCVQCGRVPLDRGRFFARRLEERHRTRSHCC
jgi:hypothetical protein